jgi:hypothetical protein
MILVYIKVYFYGICKVVHGVNFICLWGDLLHAQVGLEVPNFLTSRRFRTHRDLPGADWIDWTRPEPAALRSAGLLYFGAWKG